MQISHFKSINWFHCKWEISFTMSSEYSRCLTWILSIAQEACQITSTPIMTKSYKKNNHNWCILVMSRWLLSDNADTNGPPCALSWQKYNTVNPPMWCKWRTTSTRASTNTTDWKFWRFSISQMTRVQCAVVCLGSRIGAGDTNTLVNLIRKLALWLAAQLKLWWRKLKRNCYSSWIVLTDWFSSAAIRKATGILYYCNSTRLFQKLPEKVSVDPE